MRLPLIADARVFFKTMFRLGLSHRDITVLTSLTLLFTILEGMGIGLMYPVLIYIENGASAFVPGSPKLGLLGRVVEFLGLTPSLGMLLALALVPLLLRQGIQYARTMKANALVYDCLRRLEGDGIQAALHADMEFFHRNNLGDIVFSLRRESNRAASVIRLGAEVVSSMLLLVIYFVLLVYLAPYLAMTAGSIFIAAGTLYRVQMRKAARIGQLISQTDNRRETRVVQVLQSVAAIKMRGAEDAVTHEVKSLNDDAIQANWNGDCTRLRLEGSVQPLLLVAAVAIFFIGVNYLNVGLATLGMFVFVLLRVVPVLANLATVRFTMTQNAQALDGFERFMRNARLARTVIGGSRPFQGIRETLRLEHVSFRYAERSDRPALDDIDLTLRHGQTVALVGRSGAGKSTLVNLIPRLVLPSSGRILFDGVPGEEFDLQSLRRRIAFVPQETVLFDDTIRANITFGATRPIDDDAVWVALKRAHCAEFVGEMPERLDTMVGDRGVRLSGGQRQRLSFARALVHDPDILILDEPTSALDSASEAAIQETLAGLHGRITVIIIAHRLATIQNADNIVVLDDGRVVAQGTHKSLLAGDNVYRKLFEMQMHA